MMQDSSGNLRLKHFGFDPLSGRMYGLGEDGYLYCHTYITEIKSWQWVKKDMQVHKPVTGALDAK